MVAQSVVRTTRTRHSPGPGIISANATSASRSSVARSAAARAVTTADLSERDIREQVKRRKISGGTRSDDGRRARDTFASLKKTCRKLGVSFWAFLGDRVRDAGAIPSLPSFIEARALSP